MTDVVETVFLFTCTGAHTWTPLFVLSCLHVRILLVILKENQLFFRCQVFELTKRDLTIFSREDERVDMWCPLLECWMNRMTDGDVRVTRLVWCVYVVSSTGFFSSREGQTMEVAFGKRKRAGTLRFIRPWSKGALDPVQVLSPV